MKRFIEGQRITKFVTIFGMNKLHETFNFVFFPGAISMSILLLTLMLPSETPLKPFSESYVDFALPIEVQSCDNAFYVPY